MSQCHDTYDPVAEPGTLELKGNDEALSGDQCHDLYEGGGWTTEQYPREDRAETAKGGTLPLPAGGG